ncbi:MAG: carbohydrate kinase [Ruminococcaceae bacterium]|nr:carbohydrate kinase [Oscillospiraceae bacterium]
MQKMHYLLLDIGTGSTRAALAEAGGHIIDTLSFENSYYRDETYADALYFLPEELKSKIISLCRQLTEKHPEANICAVSASAARQSFVLLDKYGIAFLGLPNIDNRGRGYADSIAGKADIYKKSGKWVTEDTGAAKLLGLMQKRPALYHKLDKFLSLSEWLAYIFTSELCFEHSQACETQLYDLAAASWSSELCSAYGINSDILPPLVCAGESLGNIMPDIAAETGINPDAVFLVGGADTQLALLQMRMKKGDVAVVSGTTSPVVTLSDEFFYDKNERVWVNANLAASGFVTEMNPGVTGLNYQRIKKSLCPDISYAELEEIYSKKRSFACTASFSSLLFYEKRALKNGGFFMRSPLGEELSREDMLWAVLADVACSIYEQLKRLKAISNNESSTLLCCGGGFRSAALCQMLSDLCGLELILYSGFEEASLGGLILLCNKAAGISTKADEEADIAKKYYPGKDRLIHSYHPVWEKNRQNANK